MEGSHRSVRGPWSMGGSSGLGEGDGKPRTLYTSMWLGLLAT